jgi:sialidase-1
MLIGIVAASVLTVVGPSVSAQNAGGEILETQDLFKAGEGGYARYHIPGLVVTKRGTVLAWCEARRGNNDWSSIDILLRRSTDAGKTWDKPQKIADVPGPKPRNPITKKLKGKNTDDVTYNNPVLIADRDGAVHFLFCLDYYRVFYARSDDDGATWSKPTEITESVAAARKTYDWRVVATGPNHGIQLRTGRLLVPMWMSTATGANGHRPSVTTTLYSDDAGRTWHVGEIAVPNTEAWVNPNETVAVELADGRVLLNIRNESPDYRRLTTTSADGATKWSEPKFDERLVEPICMASIIRYSQAPGAKTSAGPLGDVNRILFANPANLERGDGKLAQGKGRDRKNLTLRVSYDECGTWPISRTLDAGYSSYSDLAVTHDGTILCFYGCGDKPQAAGDQLRLARCNLAWLTAGKDAGGPRPPR